MRCRQGLSRLLRTIIIRERNTARACSRVSRLLARFGNAQNVWCREELSCCGLPAPPHVGLPHLEPCSLESLVPLDAG